MTCDYPARYYSLYDIDILAPVFMMVISFGFVPADEFQLCVDNEFQLCVGNCHVALGWIFGFGIVLLLLTVYSM